MGFEILKSLLIRFVSAIPNIVAAILVALIGVMLAKAIGKIVERIFSTIGLDSLADKLNEIDLVQQYNVRIKPSKVFGMIIYYMLLLIFLIAATDILGMPAVSQLISDLINYVPNIVTALIVLVVGLIVANGLKNIVLTTAKSLGIPSAGLVANFVFYFIFVTALISALSQARIDTDFVKNNLSIILGGGVMAFALGYGLASRDMMSNFLASFYSRRHFNVGDTVRVGNVEGVIVYTDGSCVKIQSAERLVVIPLSKMMKEEVEILPSDNPQIPER